jgi:uncharacterized protein YneF (UPF0154 family)
MSTKSSAIIFLIVSYLIGLIVGFTIAKSHSRNEEEYKKFLIAKEINKIA